MSWYLCRDPCGRSLVDLRYSPTRLSEIQDSEDETPPECRTGFEAPTGSCLQDKSMDKNWNPHTALDVYVSLYCRCPYQQTPRVNSIHEKVIFCQNKLYTELLATNPFSLYHFIPARCFDTHGVSIVTITLRKSMSE
jgi:hypothetical protein